ncbi:hypothetical protein I6N90_06535 [Paenibacillus sp. GSMTC-2017]|uniref:TadE/TadG family type IV pilus assembly protein n=1 Tax=Paenibacillus sp. GSMTC-2017 TaxID=2794350 RepID=UPI001A29C333|nr:TadE/TadG family type IV pilus assembly protein [Paenibacillus sp. GSMTC-2017]MBH5317471.1 hypothetical protein [Paenibacillus sp. GSMTC-2017]
MNKKMLFKWYREERGSFTIESVIVFPMLLGLVLLFILFGMYLYQNVIVLYSSNVTAERAAFGWDNSHREPKSGMLLKSEYDGLYRRMGSDGMLASLFGMTGSTEETSLKLPNSSEGGQANDSQSLTNKKMMQAASWMSVLDGAYSGQMVYTGSGLKRFVEVRMEKPIDLLTWEKSWMKEDPAATSMGHIVDPVEFIRSVDLVRYYTAKFINSPVGKTTAKDRANQALAPYQQP